MPAATIRCREMKMDTQRLILLFIFSFSLLMLWEAWNKQGRPTPAPAAPSAQQGVPAPKPAAPEAASKPAASTVPGAEASAKGETIRVTTDLVVAELDTLGATLKRVELLQHKDSRDPTKPFVLLGAEHQYEAQSGLAGDAGPNHRSLWRVQQGERSLAPGRDAVEVKFSASGKDGLEVTKTYTFKRDSYVIDVALELRNAGAAAASTYAYFQLTHDGKPDTPTNSVASTFGAQSFIGFGVYTDEHKYQKVHLSDLDKGKSDLHVKQADNDWLAFVQHYFVSAWLPPEAAPRDYVTEKRPDGTYAGRLMFPASVAPGASARVSAPLYAGPQEQRRLRAAALLAAAAVPQPERQLGRRHHPADGHHQAAVLPAFGGELQVDGQDEAGDAPPHQDPRAVRARPPEDEPGDDGALQDREDQPARRLLPDRGPDSGVHRPVLGAARGDRAAPRALRALDPRSRRARSLLRPADPHDRDHGAADQDESGAAGPGPGAGHEVHAVRLQHLLFLLPCGAGALLAGQQHSFDPAAVADPAHVRPRQACPCQAVR